MYQAHPFSSTSHRSFQHNRETNFFANPKIVEESPSPFLTADLRKEMGEKAVAAAKAVHYSGAGTIEFLVDKDRHFYFLEMNTRLQVEHPITEEVVGVDLVKEQIRIANNEVLHLRQEDLFQRGHAIECRIFAEDTENNFMPSPGIIRAFLAINNVLYSPFTKSGLCMIRFK